MTERLVRAMLAMVTTWAVHGHTWTSTPPTAEVRQRIEVRARAIVAGIAATPYGTAETPSYTEVAAMLAVVSFYETTFGDGGVEFGACAHLCRHHCGQCRVEPLEATAAWAAGVLLRAGTECGAHPSIATRLGYYHSGACRADAFSQREALRVRVILAGWGWH